MLRTLLLSVAACGLALSPALAGEPGQADATAQEAFTNHLNWLAKQKEMRAYLARAGYIVTSDLNTSSNGLLVGTALKDGKQVIVGVRMPPRPQPTPLTN